MWMLATFDVLTNYEIISMIWILANFDAALSKSIKNIAENNIVISESNERRLNSNSGTKIVVS